MLANICTYTRPQPLGRGQKSFFYYYFLKAVMLHIKQEAQSDYTAHLSSWPQSFREYICKLFLL